MEIISEKTYKKILSAFSQERGFLFGDVNFETSEKEEIKLFCQNIINLGISKKNWPANFPEILTAFLIITTKNYSKDWNGYVYWDKIIPELGFKRKLDYVNELPAIAQCFKKYNLPFFKGANGDNRYVESLFFQAYSPKTSICSFVRLAWKLFSDSDVFDYTYSSDTEYCLAIIKMLSRQYSGDELDDDMEFEGEKYSIRSGLRYAFKNCPETSASLLDRILVYINRLYNNNEDITEENEYLSDICSDEMDVIFSKKTKKRERRNSFVEVTNNCVDDLKKFRATYYFDENSNKLYLFMPKIRLYKIEKDYKNMNVEIYVNMNGTELEVKKVQLEAQGLDFKKAFSAPLICLNEYFSLCNDKFSFRIKTYLDEDLILDTKDEMFRDFFVFKNNREVKGNCKPNLYSIILPNSYNEKNIVFKNGLTKIDDNVFFVNAEENDRLAQLDTKVFFNSKKSDSHYYFDLENTKCIEECYVNYNDIEYSLYTNIGTLNCVIDGGLDSKSLFFILKNVKTEETKKCSLSNYLHDNDVFCIDEFDELDNGFYNFCVIDLNKKNNNLVFEANVLLDKKARFSMSNDISFLDDDIEIKGLILGQQFQKKFFVDNEIKSIHVGDFTIQIYMPYFNWRINNEEKNWISLIDDNPVLYGRHGNIQSNDLLNIDTSFEIVSVKCGNTELQQGNKSNSFKLGYFIMNGKNNRDDLLDGKVIAKVKINNNIFDFPLFKISDKPYLINEDSIIQCDYNENLTISLINNFVGDEDTNFVLKVTQVKPSYENKKINIEGNFAKLPYNLNDYLSDGEYEADLFYYNSYDGKGNIRLTNDISFIIGDEAQFRFDQDDVLTIYKCVPSNKIKVQSEISNIRYIGNDGFSSIFSCKLKAGNIRNFDCYFKTDSNSTTAIKLFYKENSVDCYFSYDVTNKCISKNKIDQKKYILCETVYCK